MKYNNIVQCIEIFSSFKCNELLLASLRILAYPTSSLISNRAQRSQCLRWLPSLHHLIIHMQGELYKVLWPNLSSRFLCKPPCLLQIKKTWQFKQDKSRFSIESVQSTGATGSSVLVLTAEITLGLVLAPQSLIQQGNQMYRVARGEKHTTLLNCVEQGQSLCAFQWWELG